MEFMVAGVLRVSPPRNGNNGTVYYSADCLYLGGQARIELTPDLYNVASTLSPEKQVKVNGTIAMTKYGPRFNASKIG